ncbi:MAG: TIM-barrel domain-containing protein, partial [Candidatus Dormibacteria bacterium]
MFGVEAPHRCCDNGTEASAGGLKLFPPSIGEEEMKRTFHRLAVAGIAALLAGISCFAQGWQSLGPADGIAKLPAGVRLTAGDRQVTVTVISDSTVRVQVERKGAPPAEKSWAVLPENSSSAPKVSVSEQSNAVEISLASGSVRIMKNPLQIVFLDAQGKVINQDSTRAPMAFNGASFRVTKVMPEGEEYFGLGDKTTLNLRNRAFTLWNTDAYGWQESTDPLYKSIPFFMGLNDGRAYGIFLDDTWRSSFDFGKASRDTYSFGAEGGELNYYFFFGPDPKKVLMSYADLTGKAPLPPLWSLGYQQSRWSYYPESRVLEVARTFREKKIPADVLYLDIDYQDHLRPFTINRDYFPTFEKMIQDLGQEGFSVIAITDLHIAKVPGYKPYDDGLSKDEFVKNPDGSMYVGKVWPGETVFPEFTLTRSREWWGGLYKDFVGMGIRGFWNDMNEPAIFDTSTRTMPLDVVDRLDDGASVDQRSIHNVFGMLNSRATYEGVRKLNSNERPFVL